MRDSTKTAVCVLSACVILVSCSADRGQDRRDRNMRAGAAAVQSAVEAERKLRDRAVEEYVGSLSLEEQTAQLFIENLEGDALFTPVERTGALHGKPGTGAPLIPGGYLFFSYNIADTPQKTASFTASIRSYCTAWGIVPPYLALDQEGGEVNRLRGIAGPLPSQERVALCMTPAQAYELYSLQAVQMRALGFTMNLAPVAEVCTDANRSFLAGRSFGSEEQAVAYGTAGINGFQNNGVAAVLKHFPGNTNTDPHTGLPEIVMSSDDIDRLVIYPFMRLAAHNPAGVLMSHARVSSLDSGVPACMSHEWVSGRLRGSCGFGGLVFSDDIFMGALSRNGYPPEKAALQAVEAGVDVIMISEKKFAGPASVLVARAEKDPAFAGKIRVSCGRVIRFKIAYGVLRLIRKDGAYTVVSAGMPADTLSDYGASFRRNTELCAAAAGGK
jgi:beta-N-acetylhexosaminidase